MPETPLARWFSSRFAPGAKQFARGFATGAGIPTSLGAARDLAAKGLGTMFGIPEAYDAVGQDLGSTVEGLAQTVRHPIQTARTLGSLASADPVGAAGVAMGMASPLGWRRGSQRWPLPIKEGIADVAGMQSINRELRNALRRPEARIARERARVHASLEGPTGPLPHLGETNPWAPSDDLINTPSEVLQAGRRDAISGGAVAHARVLDKELLRRGERPDISDELHALHEGLPMAERGLDDPMELFSRRPITPEVPIWTREERGASLLNKVDLPQGENTAQYMARTLDEKFPKAFLGKVLNTVHGRFVKTMRGWTKLPD